MAAKAVAEKKKPSKSVAVAPTAPAPAPVPAPAPEPKPEVAPEAAKPTKPTKKPALAKKAAVERDAFGCRSGSQAAAINATLGKKPKSVEKIIEESKLATARVRSHLKFLVAKGMAKESDEGFASTLKPNA